MRVLMLGDIAGRPGRKAVESEVKNLCEELDIDFVIANGENAAGGNGITREIADDLFDSGIDCLTMGNHVWDKKEIFDFIDVEKRILRPANYPPGTPGIGATVYRANREVNIGIISLSGLVFMAELDCPFRKADELITQLSKETKIIIIDFHAEVTSEKIALGWYLDGRVTAVCGTHTHVQTADERVLPGGTGYITDLGMTGPRDGVIGVKKEIVINKFLTRLPQRFEKATGSYQLNGVVIDIDEKTGKAMSISRINILEKI
ncbi:MAG: TIGR00282 family metallophosphoesterase [Clostridia bacterium]|nr:TIGR00282 family metallophosphoesterase [Clostridia bacterium]